MAAFSRNGKPVGLDAQYVGRLPCATCGIRSMKLPGQQGGLCIPCYADECATAGRRAATAGAWVPASFVGDPCLACGRGPWTPTGGRSGATRVRFRRLWPCPRNKRGARTGEGKVILPSAPSDAERIGFDGRDEAAPAGAGERPRAGCSDTWRSRTGTRPGEVVGDLQAFAAVTIAVAALPPICGTQVKSFAGHFDNVLSRFFDDGEGRLRWQCGGPEPIVCLAVLLHEGRIVDGLGRGKGPYRVHQRRLVIKLHEHERQFHERTSRGITTAGSVERHADAAPSLRSDRAVRPSPEAARSGPGPRTRDSLQDDPILTNFFGASKSLARCNRARTFTSTSSGRSRGCVEWMTARVYALVCSRPGMERIAPPCNGPSPRLRLRDRSEVRGVRTPPRLPYVLTSPLEEPIGLQHPVHMPGEILRHPPRSTLDLAQIKLGPKKLPLAVS